MSAKFLSAPVARWTAPDIAVMPNTEPVFGYGSVYYVSQDGNLEAIDFQTGKPKWSQSPITSLPLETPLLHGGVLYVSSDLGNLYAVNPQTGALLWPQPAVVSSSGSALSPPFVSWGYVAGVGASKVVYVTDQSNVYALPPDFSSGNAPAAATVYTASDVQISPDTPVYDPQTKHMVLGTSKGLRALEVNLVGEGVWAEKWDADLGGFVTPPTTAMEKVFVGTPAETMAIVDIAAGGHIQSDKLQSTIEHPVTVFNNLAYVPTNSGNIFFLDATSAKVQGSPVKPGGQVTTPIKVASGVAYFGSGDSRMYGFKLEAPTQTIAYDAGKPIQYLTHVVNGTSYFGTADTIHNVDFLEIINEFTSHSEYMVDYVSASGEAAAAVGAAAALQQTPTFRSQLTLYDTDQNIRPRESVKLWASHPTTVHLGAHSYQIGPDQPLAWQTDSSGKLEFTVEADADIQPGVPSGLSAPSLQLWAGFMQEGERILVFPDQRLHQKLQNITGAQLQNATGYNQADPKSAGPQLLPKGFQGPDGLKNANTLAKAVNNTVVIQKPSGETNVDLMGGTSDKYLTYTSSMLGVSYWPSNPKTARPPLSGEVPNWSLDLTNADSPVFTPHADADEVEAVMLAHRQELFGDAEFNIFGDIAHFIDHVIHGVENILKAAWQVVEDSISAIIHTAENVYKFVVKTVEEAAHVVVAIFKAIVKDVKLILEALSWLFRWEDILKTHDAIKGAIKDTVGQAKTYIEKARSDADGFFKNLEGRAEADIQSIIQQMTGRSFGAQAQKTSDPTNAFTANSHHYAVQSHWMASKIRDHALGSHGSVTIAPPPAAGGLASGETVVQALEQFVVQVVQASGQVAEDLGELVVAAGKEFVEMVTDPAKARSSGVADVLEKLEKLVVDLLKLANIVVDDFLDLLAAVIQEVYDELDASVDIPFISELYRLLTGNDLSILDLISLLLAIPVTIVYKAATGRLPSFGGTAAEAFGSLSAAAGSLQVLPLVYLIDQIFFGLFDTVQNALALEPEPVAFVNYVIAVFIFVRQVSTFPIHVSSAGAFVNSYLMWLYHFSPLVFQVAAARAISAGKTFSPVYTSVYGVGNALWQGISAAIYPASFFDDGYRLGQNEALSLSSISKIARLSANEYVILGLIVGDLFLDFANGLMEVKYLEGGPG